MLGLSVALSIGVPVDGAVFSIVTFDEHTSVPDVLIISSHVWNKLNEEEKQWLQQAADDSVPVQREYWEASVKESLEEVQKAGVQIYYPDKQAFADLVGPIYDTYKNHPTIFNYIQRIQAVE